jgi:hypothetical protein
MPPSLSLPLSHCQAGPAHRGHPRPRARLRLEPESSHGTSPTPARAAPCACTSRPLGRPIKPPPRALGPSIPQPPPRLANPSCVSPPPQHLASSLLPRATTGVLPWGKGYRRPAFPLPLPIPPRHLLAVAAMLRLAVVCLPWSPAPRSKPLNTFPSSLSFS